MTTTQVSIPVWNGTTGNYTIGRTYWNGPTPGKKASVGKIIYHWIDGTQASADTVFMNPGSIRSAHLSIEDSSVHQYVSFDNTAYHAGIGTVNCESIGIEHSAQPGRDATDATYESSAQMVYQIAQHFGKNIADFQHLPHSAVIATACPGTIDISRIVKRAQEIESGVQIIDTSVTIPIVRGPFWIQTTAKLNVRTAPEIGNDIVSGYSLNSGSQVEIDGYVDGDTYTIYDASGKYLGTSGTWCKSDLHKLYFAAAYTKEISTPSNI